MIKHLLTLCAVVAMGCSDASAPESSLDAARRRWAATAPASYEVTVSRLCFCLQEAVQPVVVTVRNGVVESRRYAGNGQPVDPRWAALSPTVDQLFDVIDDAIRRHAATMDATYDAQRGYPTSVTIDYDTRLADEEVAFRVTAFKPL